MKQIGADDPEAKSADIVAGNVEQLKALFPESVTEGNIDFAVLRQLLGDAVDEREEKYGLNWHGKRRARQLALTPSTGTLRPCPEESVDWDTTQNLMIEGDNLEVLKLLQKSYAGKIKLIYIDPPYNTGKDFVYKDDYQDNIKNYLMLTGQVDSDGRKISSNAESSGRFHTDWLSMMYPRLLLARTLLSQTGVILLSIDDGELGSLMKILTEIFGEENFVGTLVWKGATDNNPTQIAIEHEYLVCFARAKESVAAVWKNSADAAKATLLSEYDRIKMRGISADLEQAELRSFIRANREALTSVTHYDRVDAQGVYTGSRKVHNPKPGGYVYDVMHPVTGTPCARPVNGYRYPKPAMDELLANNRILFGEHETQIIQIKEYLIDFEGKLSSVLHLDSRTGANELNDLFGVQKLFPSPKPVALLTDIFEFILGPGDLVLDFFAGSGSTCHAAWKLNSLDGGDRRCVLMQLPQPLDPDDKEQSTASSYCDQMVRPRILSELTKERLRRAGAKVKDDNPMFAGDTGFRVFKLASSNIQQWDPNRDDIATSLEASVEHLKTDRTEADILYELLLKRGLDLCVPIEKREIAGKEVHAVGGGVLLACLTGTISKDDAEALALGIVEWHAALAPAGETTCVFRDSAFEDDVAKSNVAAILEQHGLTSVKSL